MPVCSQARPGPHGHPAPSQRHTLPSLTISRLCVQWDEAVTAWGAEPLLTSGGISSLTPSICESAVTARRGLVTFLHPLVVAGFQGSLRDDGTGFSKIPAKPRSGQVARLRSREGRPGCGSPHARLHPMSGIQGDLTGPWPKEVCHPGQRCRSSSELTLGGSLAPLQSR